MKRGPTCKYVYARACTHQCVSLCPSFHTATLRHWSFITVPFWKLPIRCLHLEIYRVPSQRAEGQREHFCESYLSGFLHLVNIMVGHSFWCVRIRRPGSTPQCTKSGWVAFFSGGHIHPLGSGPSSEAVRKLLQRGKGLAFFLYSAVQLLLSNSLLACIMRFLSLT